MKRNSWLKLTRRLGTPPDGFQRAWSRHILFTDDLKWFGNALWVLFEIDLDQDSTKVLHELVEAYPKYRVAQYFLWYRDNLGEASSLDQLNRPDLIDGFGRALTPEDHLFANLEEDICSILASHGY